MLFNGMEIDVDNHIKGMYFEIHFNDPKGRRSNQGNIAYLMGYVNTRTRTVIISLFYRNVAAQYKGIGKFLLSVTLKTLLERGLAEVNDDIELAADGKRCNMSRYLAKSIDDFGLNNVDAVDAMKAIAVIMREHSSPGILTKTIHKATDDLIQEGIQQGFSLVHILCSLMNQVSLVNYYRMLGFHVVGLFIGENGFADSTLMRAKLYSVLEKVGNS